MMTGNFRGSTAYIFVLIGVVTALILIVLAY